MSFEATGERGELRVGYRRAADVRGWRIVKREQMLADPVTVLTGRLENQDRFWLSRTEFAVRLNFKRCTWVWDQAELISKEPLEVWLYNDPRSIQTGG